LASGGLILNFFGGRPQGGEISLGAAEPPQVQTDRRTDGRTDCLPLVWYARVFIRDILWLECRLGFKTQSF